MKYTIITMVLIVFLIIGVRHWDMFHNWKGMLATIISALLLSYNSFYLEQELNKIQEKGREMKQ